MGNQESRDRRSLLCPVSELVETHYLLIIMSCEATCWNFSPDLYQPFQDTMMTWINRKKRGTEPCEMLPIAVVFVEDILWRSSGYTGRWRRCCACSSAASSRCGPRKSISAESSLRRYTKAVETTAIATKIQHLISPSWRVPDLTVFQEAWMLLNGSEPLYPSGVSKGGKARLLSAQRNSCMW
jgi:hypothetical protein